MQAAGVLFAIPWMFILLAVVLRCRCYHFTGLSKTSLALLFILKVIATFGLQAIYTYYYPDRNTADIYRFFDDGVILFKVLSHNASDYLSIMTGLFSESDGFRELYFEKMNSWIKPFESGIYNDNHFMIRLNSVMCFFSHCFYEVHGLFFSFFAFSGIVLIIKSLLSGDDARARGLVILSFLPSYLLWCSGGLKETVLVFSLGAILPLVLYPRMQNRPWVIVLFLVGAATSLLVKPYYFGALFLASAVLHFRHLKYRFLHPWLTWPAVALLSICILYLLDVDVLGLIISKQHEFLNHAEVLRSGSYFFMDRLDHNWVSIAIHAPEAIFNTLLRPLPWQLSGIPEFILFYENCYILFFGVLAVRQCLKYKQGHYWLTAWAIQFVFPVLLLIGLTTPVLGAVMRYRAPAVLIILAMCVAFLHREEMNNKRIE